MADYTPLGGPASFPADPAALHEYGAGLVQVGALIADSVALLRRVAGTHDWKTEAANAFRDKAGDLADEIDKTRGRYEDVGRDLVRVSDTLEHAAAQAAGYAAQARAEEGAARRSEVVPDTDPTGAPVPLTPAQTAANAQREAAIAEIARLQGLFDQQVQAARDAADAAARTIHGALDDGVKDSWWDRNAHWLRWVASAAGAIAAVAAVVLLTVATGGTIWLVAVAVSLAAGLVALGVHTGLAASGNGSWWDVAFDAVGLLSFGVGSLVAKGLTRTMPLLRDGYVALRGAAAFDDAFGGVRLALGNALSRVPLSLVRGLGVRVISSLAEDAFEAGEAARRAASAVPVITRTERVLQGGREVATGFAQAREVLTELRGLGALPAHLLPESERLAEEAGRAADLYRLQIAAAAVGTVNGLAQGGLVLVGGLDPKDLGSMSTLGQIVIDVLGRLR